MVLIIEEDTIRGYGIITNTGDHTQFLVFTETGESFHLKSNSLRFENLHTPKNKDTKHFLT